MAIIGNRTLVVTAIVLMLATCLLIGAFPAVTAQTKTLSRAFVSVNPKIVGIGQPVLINAWTSPQPPLLPNVTATSGYGIGRPRENYTYTFTRPNSSKVVIVGGPSFGEGTAWLFYTPDVIGNWSVTLYWQGDELFTNCTSPPFYFEVRDKPMYSYLPEVPLPTGYWTRPINAENRMWYQVSGDWRQASYSTDYSKWNPYSFGPGSAHILWTWQGSNWVGGLIGGPEQSMAISTASERSSLAVGRVVNGRAYISQWDGTHCVDVKTGKEIWVKTMALGTFAATPTWDYLHDMPAYMGGEQPYANIYNYVSTTVNGTPMVQVWDPWKGEIYKNITGPNAGFNCFDDVHGYFYRYSGGQLIKWDPNRNLGMGGLGTTTGTNFTSLIVWNVSGVPAAPRHFVGDVGIVVSGGKLWRINLNDGSATSYNTTAPTSTVLDLKTGTLFGGGGTGGLTMNFTAWDLYGNQKWISQESEYPFGWFWSYGGFSASPGLFHHDGYDGHLYAWNATTGKIQWAFYAGDSGVDTPTNTWTFWNNIVSAGPEGGVRVYAGNGEHTPAQPAWRGQRLFCVDQKTGKEVWHIAFSPLDKVIGDGVLMVSNYYDGLLYGFGKGQSTTTVAASPKVTQKGSTVLIEGTVMDMSPGQPNTPAISDASMGDWMEYLHMQKPMPTNAMGVNVKLSAVRPDGSAEFITTVTSDSAGLFKALWKPSVEGAYTIIATFEGSESYGSSFAETALGVVPTPSASVAPTPIVTVQPSPSAPSTQSPLPSPTETSPSTSELPTASPSPTTVPPPTMEAIDMYLVSAIAVITIIVVIAVAAFLLRRRK
jgi:hypothetical protein